MKNKITAIILIFLMTVGLVASGFAFESTNGADVYADPGTECEHAYETVVMPATQTDDGKISKVCSVCGDVESVEAIPKIKSISLSSSAFTYDGKVKTPAVTVKNGEGDAIDSSNYTLSFSSGRKNVGTYTVTVAFKGNYSGSAVKSFVINPKGTSLTKVKKTSKSKLSIKWKKNTTQTSGYQLQYSTDKTFKTGAKTVSIGKNTQTSKTIKKLKTLKRYYVRIRTYKKVGSKTYYSAWSSRKSAVESLGLSCKAAVIIRVDGGVLYSKNRNKRLANASTTKMMTALLCMENMKTKEIVKFSSKAAKTPYGCLNAKKGYKFYMKDLLSAMLVRSSNDSAAALGEHMAGSTAKFAKMMNKRAKKLGMKNTHFKNAHGLDSKKHYSSAYDLALLQKENIKYSLYRKIISKKSYSFRNVQKTKKYKVTTTDKLLGYKNLLGGKTGYTGKAGYCFCGVYKYKGKTYIFTVLGGKTSNSRWNDCKKLMKYIRYNPN